MKIDKLQQISTKTGDTGTSKNYSDVSYKKNDIVFETLGTIDELSSFLGLSYHQAKLENIIAIQKKLQNINSIIATSPNSRNYSNLVQIEETDVEWIEIQLQKAIDIKPLVARFTLPGSEKSALGAYFDFARTLARKSERRVIDFSEKHDRNDLNLVKKYLNRLSDYLYVLACNI
ncbi:MAG: ATP:cob(I)alamin adenosyltransferase [Tenericutes bacterium]|nr:ATP:cob(I)alamin adenosyltransferase [Mycoplasmatota bacterium]